MGRLATNVAANAVFADNVRPSEKLPSVSIIDALLPKNWSIGPSSRKQPLDPNDRAPSGSVHTDVERDSHGKMVLVRHRPKNGGGVDNRNQEVTFKDVKKNRNGDNGAKGKSAGGGTNAGAAFTAEEDAKLRELKVGGSTWKQIAEEMKHSQHELKTRWKEIEGKPAAGGDQKKDGGGNGAKEGGGDLTAEDDEKIKELLASNTGFKKIATALGCSLDGPLREHINKLKAETGGSGGGGGNKNNKDDKKGGDRGFSEKDKAKIGKLLESNTGYKKIAEALGCSLDQALKDEIGKIKAGQGGDNKKKDDGGKEKEKNKGGDGGGKKDKEKEKSKKEDTKPSKPASNAPSHHSEARFTMEEWRTLQEDEMFTFGELQLLSEIIMKDISQSWLKVASRFHDKTGRRVHPDDIRDKFDQMAQMGKR